MTALGGEDVPRDPKRAAATLPCRWTRSITEAVLMCLEGTGLDVC
jgi:hypothetical protein